MYARHDRPNPPRDVDLCLLLPSTKAAAEQRTARGGGHCRRRGWRKSVQRSRGRWRLSGRDKRGAWNEREWWFDVRRLRKLAFRWEYDGWDVCRMRGAVRCDVAGWVVSVADFGKEM